MNNFRNSLTAFAVAAALGLSSTVMAAETGGLKIKVTDKNGNAIAGATVLVKAPDALVSKTAVSDAEGYVSLRGLDASNQYTVSINGSDIQSFEASDVRVITGKIAKTYINEMMMGVSTSEIMKKSLIDYDKLLLGLSEKCILPNWKL